MQPLILYYRSAIECLEFKLGDPRYKDHLDFIPRREYTDESKTERLYNEIMTGDLAWSLQVCLIDYLSLRFRVLKSCCLGERRTWRNSRTNNPGFGQNTPYGDSRGYGVPCIVYDMRKYQKVYPVES